MGVVILLLLATISLPSLAMTGTVVSVRVLGLISLAVLAAGIVAGELAVVLGY
jgi:hypothetical protein